MLNRIVWLLAFWVVTGCTIGDFDPPDSIEADRATPGMLPSSRLSERSCWADHFITYTSTPIDRLMESYQKAGFITSPPDRTVRHEPGLRNGFVMIGPEYLEFCWVERESEFESAVEKEPFYRSLRAAERPYGIGFQVLDPSGFRDQMARAGYDAPEVFFARPQDAPENSAPRWAGGLFPDGALPGVHAFYLSYLGDGAENRNRNLCVSENGIFLIAGCLLVSAEPRSRASRWSRLLSLSSERSSFQSSRGFIHGPHAYAWITGAEWGKIAGFEFPRSDADFHELTAVIAISVDLERTSAYLEQGEIPFESRELDLPLFGARRGIVVHPKIRTGFPMIVLNGDLEPWKRWREEVQGNSLDVRREYPQ